MTPLCSLCLPCCFWFSALLYACLLPTLEESIQINCLIAYKCSCLPLNHSFCESNLKIELLWIFRVDIHYTYTCKD